MLLPMKRVLVEHNIWVVKMVANNATIDNAKAIYKFLCDLKTLNKILLVLLPLVRAITTTKCEYNSLVHVD